jgi:hypothetical protein
MKLADIATGAVLLWALAALAWPDQPQPPRPTPQRLASPISTTPTPQPIPDRRTLTQFPGP